MYFDNGVRRVQHLNDVFSLLDVRDVLLPRGTSFFPSKFYLQILRVRNNTCKKNAWNVHVEHNSNES